MSVSIKYEPEREEAPRFRAGDTPSRDGEVWIFDAGGRVVATVLSTPSQSEVVRLITDPRPPPQESTAGHIAEVIAFVLIIFGFIAVTPFGWITISLIASHLKGGR